MVSFFGLLSNTLTPHPKYETQTGLMKKKKAEVSLEKIDKLRRKRKNKKNCKMFCSVPNRMPGVAL